MKFKLKDNRTGRDTAFKTTLKISVKKGNLTFNFKCKNSKCFCANEGFNTNLYDGDVCEAFICTSGDINKYYEVEVAPNGSAFFKSLIRENGKRTATPEEDVIDRSVKKGKNGYKVKFSVPLEYIKYDKDKKLFFNAYRIETEGGIKDKNLLAVNPTMSDTFHSPEYFIEFKI